MHLTSPAKKLIGILILFLIALFISLPRPNLNLKVGRFEIKKSFDLKLGLDLAGGAHLVFEADSSKISSDKLKDAVASLKEVVEKRVNLFGISEPVVQTSSFGGKERIIVELPGIQNTQEAVNLIGKTAQLIFAEVPQEASPSAGIIPTDLTGADLERASVDFDRTTGKPIVALKFTKEGGEKFGDITERNIGRQVPIILDKEIISMPVVKEKISGGNAIISGDFTIEEARELVVQLNAGALPLPIVLVEERVVQATLGTESVSQSVKAGLVGLVMVLAFMILSYGRLGIVSAVGLIIFGVLTLALYKLIPVVLTLPGIAGFLLSVGMAVDSNILIFERFKEEKGRRPIPDALEVSFGRAWDSIRDANIATLVTAFILANPFDWDFLHTSGPVRGFAITLALGIGISLFTGIVVSRNLLRVFIREKKA
ncbi:protein translocase subunit SecD [Candidatus Woesebacteria bacterium]|nr:protein translocase subunit SecD [Candidatus Woesebacteria bacterium]